MREDVSMAKHKLKCEINVIFRNFHMNRIPRGTGFPILQLYPPRDQELNTIFRRDHRVLRLTRITTAGVKNEISLLQKKDQIERSTNLPTFRA